MLEGCVAGVIPLVSPTTGAEEDISPIDASLVIDIKNPKTYAQKILELYAMPEDRKKILAAQLKKRALRYTKQACVEEVRRAATHIEKVLGMRIPLVLSHAHAYPVARTVLVHRGKNDRSHFVGSLIAQDFFVFDYRGTNTAFMLCKAFFMSFFIPKADVYFVEGGLCLWPVYFKKMFYPSAKVILMVAGPLFHTGKRSALRNEILKKVLSIVDFVFPSSDLVARDMRFYMGHIPSHTVYRFVTMDMEKLLNTTPNYQNKNILFVIRRPKETGWTKGLDVVFNIFKEVLKLDPEFHLYLIGYGTEKLKNVLPHVHLENDQDPAEYFARCPFTLSPSRYDAFNFSIVEAAVAGVIPLVSPTTGASEFIAAVRPDFVILHEDPQSYAKKIIEIYRTDQGVKDSLALQLRAYARKFTKENTIEEFKKAIKEAEGIICYRFSFSVEDKNI